MRITQEKLKELAGTYGLSIMGISSVEPLAEDVMALKQWQDGGMAGSMSFMNRSSDLLCSARKLLPSAESIIIFCVRYEALPSPVRPEGFGRVARYAWGRDYHRVLKKLLNRFLQSLSKELGAGVEARPFTDAVPLLERGYAKRAGLGFVGKNTMLIRSGVGSLFFLCELVTNVYIECGALQISRTNSCKSCTRCHDACPTGALVSDRILDARKCISYLTIEKTGTFDAWERGALGEWVFGCDICQEVCPFNYGSLKAGVRADLEELRSGSGAGPLLSLSDTLSIRCDEEFTRRYAGTPLMRPGRENLLRNAAVVAANTKAVNMRAALEEAYRLDDSATVRESASWALGQL